MARVHDLDAARFGSHQNGRDVPADQSKETFDALGLQDAGYKFAAVHEVLDLL